MNSGVTDRAKLKSKVGSTRRALVGIQRVGRHPERCTALALPALQRGEPLGRPLTLMERLALAVTATKPTHHLVITTVGGSQGDLMDMFRRLVRRIERRRSSRLPLIYFGTVAEGTYEGGFHMHLILWEYQHMPMYHGQMRALGLGVPNIEMIDPLTPDNVLRVVAYVLGQQESVFGTRKHLANRPRDPFKRRYIHPQLKTLERYHPELFVALSLAEDKSVSDETLFAELPRFIREDKERKLLYGKGDLERELAEATN
jgi:hypothetical protein